MNNKGFTLIELLTVISIIAILAAITLVTFPAATNRAKDARIINAMQQLRTAAEASKGVYGDYSEVKADSADDTIDALMAEIDGQNSGEPSEVHVTAETSAAYCVEAALVSGRYWCIDSNMHSDYLSASTCASDNIACE
jgi:prepilin-type N-terminal cleavage/methylation domain-containing protein